MSGSPALAAHGSSAAVAASPPASGLASFSQAGNGAPAGAAASVISALFGPGPEAEGGVSAARGMRAREAALAAEHVLHELVSRLSGCLAQLPYEQRVALELRTGVGVANPLAPASIAAYLHVAERSLPALERTALLSLVRSAHASGCGGAGQSADVLALLTSMQPPFGVAVGAGGGERGEPAAPSASRGLRPARVAAAATAEDPLLGVDLPPEAQALLIALLAAGAALLIGLLFSDRFDFGARLREWRFRRTHRPSA